jgi:hypothetical protein
MKTSRYEYTILAVVLNADAMITHSNAKRYRRWTPSLIHCSISMTAVG